MFKILIMINALNALNPANHYPARIRKIDRMFASKLDFKYIKIPVKIKDIHKIEKKNSIAINVFGYENKEKCPLYVSKNTFKKRHVTKPPTTNRSPTTENRRPTHRQVLRRSTNYRPPTTGKCSTNPPTTNL